LLSIFRDFEWDINTQALHFALLIFRKMTDIIKLLARRSKPVQAPMQPEKKEWREVKFTKKKSSGCDQNLVWEIEKMKKVRYGLSLVRARTKQQIQQTLRVQKEADQWLGTGEERRVRWALRAKRRRLEQQIETSLHPHQKKSAHERSGCLRLRIVLYKVVEALIDLYRVVEALMVLKQVPFEQSQH
jgi:hypothetical protein